MKGIFCCLVSALFPPCAIILENESDALDIKWLIIRLHLAIPKSSEKTDPYKFVDSILLDKWGI